MKPQRDGNKSIKSPETRKTISRPKVVSRVALKNQIKNLEFEKELIFGELKLTRDYSKQVEEHMRQEVHQVIALLHSNSSTADSELHMKLDHLLNKNLDATNEINLLQI